MKEIWMSGGGTQSNAIAILIIEGKLPRPDLCVIADTGHETEMTWDYLDRITNPALAKIGLNCERVKAGEWSSQGARLHYPKNEKSKGTWFMPVFATTYGQPAKLSNFCTTEWKVGPIERWLSKVHGITRSKYKKWIGFTADEQRRWARMMVGNEYKKGLIRFPLVHDFRMTRPEAIKLVEKYGWPTPPRSACWHCPNKSDYEWESEKKERPEEFAKAVAFDVKMREYDPNLWLHKSCQPLGEVEIENPNPLLELPCDSGVCFV